MSEISFIVTYVSQCECESTCLGALLPDVVGAVLVVL